MTTSCTSRLLQILAGVFFSMLVLTAWAHGAEDKGGTVGDEQSVQEETGKKARIGLNIDLGYATAYGYRGLNVFQEKSQIDQNMLLAPGIKWSVFDTGLEIGYWGAFQISGKNISSNIEEGIGAKQDLFVGYTYRFDTKLAIDADLIYHFYPFAEKDAAEVAFPSYLEPHVGFGYEGGVDLWFDVFYLAALPETLRDQNYFYVNPNIGKTFNLDEFVDLELLFSFGFKIFDDDSPTENNMVDLLFSVGVPIHATDIFYIKPSFNVAWTNMAKSGHPSTDSGVLPDGRLHEDLKGEEPDEAIVWVGLNMGVDL